MPELVVWTLMPESAKRVMLDLMQLLANGFTGTIELDCNQGGVRRITETRTRQIGKAQEDT